MYRIFFVNKFQTREVKAPSMQAPLKQLASRFGQSFLASEADLSPLYAMIARSSRRDFDPEPVPRPVIDLLPMRAQQKRSAAARYHFVEDPAQKAALLHLTAEQVRTAKVSHFLMFCGATGASGCSGSPTSLAPAPAIHSNTQPQRFRPRARAARRCHSRQSTGTLRRSAQSTPCSLSTTCRLSR